MTRRSTGGNGARNGRSEAVQRPIRRVAGYVRVSTRGQAESGLGLVAQRRQVKAQAGAKGWPAPVIFADEGTSGYKESADRPGLAGLLAAVRDGQVDAIVVGSLDRLARRARLMLEIVDELIARDVQLVSAKESIDTGTPAGRMVVTVLAAMAEFERELARERTRRAVVANDEQRGETGGRRPYGYRRIQGHRGEVEVDPDAAQVVKRIFALHRRGLSLREIVAALIAKGVTAPTSKPERPTRWHASTVAAILRHRKAYQGGPRGHTRMSGVRWPVILTR